MVLNFLVHNSECVVACMVIYMNAEPGWVTGWHPLLVGIIINHYGSSYLMDTLFTHVMVPAPRDVDLGARVGLKQGLSFLCYTTSPTQSIGDTVEARHSGGKEDHDFQGRGGRAPAPLSPHAGAPQPGKEPAFRAQRRRCLGHRGELFFIF